MTRTGREPATIRNCCILELDAPRETMDIRLQTDLPENYDESIKDVESIFYVSKWSVSDDLQQHLQCEQTAEEVVAVLQHRS